MLHRPRRLPSIVSDTAYIEAVRLYLRGSSLQMLADFLVVPVAAVTELVRSREWAAQADLLRDETLHVEAAVMSRVISRSLAVCLERLEDGDHVIDKKTGMVFRQPVSAKDAASIAAVLFQQRERAHKVLDGKDPSETSGSDMTALVSIAKALGDAKRFEEWQRTQQIEGEVVHITDERKQA